MTAESEHKQVAKDPAEVLRRLLNIAAGGDQELCARYAQYLVASRGVAAGNTLAAWITGLKRWISFAATRQAPAVPARWEVVVDYIDHLATQHRFTTIQTRVWAIARLHLAAKLPSPTSIADVGLAMKRVARALGKRKRHARGAWLNHITLMHGTTDTSLRGLRDRAMTLLAYDLSARQSELMALDIDDISPAANGNGSALIAQSKTDQFGRRERVFIARDTMVAIDAWCQAAKLVDGALFRSIDRWGNVGPRLSSRGLSYTAKRLAAAAELGDGYSGHSFRVGAAQEMVANNMNLAGVLQAQRRKHADSLHPYLEDIEIERSAMADLARLQGRA